MAFDRNIARQAFGAQIRTVASKMRADPVLVRSLADVDPCVVLDFNLHENFSRILRLSLYKNGDICKKTVDETGRPGIVSDRSGDQDNFLAKVHVQDRPLFLKTIRDVLSEERPVTALIRLLERDTARLVTAWFWPGQDDGTVEAVFQPARETGISADSAVPAEKGGERHLCALAQSELLDLTSSLTVLCQSAVDGPGGDEARLETLRYLSQRLEFTAELLGALDDGSAVAPEDQQGLIGLIQEIVNAHWQKAIERDVSISVDIAGAVREPVSKRLTSLLRLMVTTAVRLVDRSGDIAIVTRREGQAVAISATLSSVREAEDAGSQFSYDLSVLRNLAIRRGGRLTLVNRHADSQQWVLRLPLISCGKAVAEQSAGRNIEYPRKRTPVSSHSVIQDMKIA